jgi:hypothetical protein
LCKTKTSIRDIYKNKNANAKGKNSVKNQSTHQIKNSSKKEISYIYYEV